MRTIESLNKEANAIKLIAVKKDRETGTFYKLFHLIDENNYNRDDWIYFTNDIEILHGFIIGYATARQLWTEEMRGR